MGQQQLILLVLATVIVGIAIVVGIRAFSENSIKANSDALVQDMVRMANDAQAWKQKPAPFGGQVDAAGSVKSAPADFRTATFPVLGYQEVGTGVYENLNGQYALSADSDGLTITGVNAQYGTCASIVVDGLTDGDIEPNGAPVLGGWEGTFSSTIAGCGTTTG